LIGAPVPGARLALYWAPDLDDPLHRDGSSWLGRDAETGAALPQPRVPGHDLAAITADPRGYGLHATLKAPFRLRVSWAEALGAAAALAARLRSFDLPPLAVRDLEVPGAAGNGALPAAAGSVRRLHGSAGLLPRPCRATTSAPSPRTRAATGCTPP
jgi:hypothetical protein